MILYSLGKMLIEYMLEWILHALICLPVLFLIYYTWRRRDLNANSRQFRGETGFPIIGSSYLLFGKDEDVLLKFVGYLKRYPGLEPTKLWLGPSLIIFFTDPNHIEKIMLSQNFSHKMTQLYDIIKNFIGEGLITTSGSMYRRHKKVIAPMLDLNFTNSCCEILQKYSNACFTEMKAYCNNETFDISHFFHEKFSMITSESILGRKLDSTKDHQLMKDAAEVYDIAFYRLVRLWIHPDIFYKLTSVWKLEQGLTKRNEIFFQEVIDKSRERVRAGEIYKNDFIAIVDKLAERIENQPDLMDDKLFRDHMYTLLLASEDTLTIVSSFLCVCLGMYPEYQKKVAEELRAHFGETYKNVSLEDIGNLPYLDMCIKETLRIVPIAPLVFRNVLEDCEIGGWKISKDSYICVPIFHVHRDKRFWENPEHFHPDHFLPEIEKQRPNYAYLPFTAGNRGCIGKIFANVNIRIFMASFLQRFEVEADGKLPDIKFRSDASTRPVHGYNVRIKERVWRS
ncbi:hypothetical protein HHI36_012320 [Cryptolaemus montrouzieri]|uniref:Cytochrome P450 n=1 Tax=Cryptolaemus montrouzieri TaxID=559131 RepID=A0ABD2NEL8_9CUCU